MKFSLRQLKFANEVCFPADFERLWKLHAEGTEYEDHLDGAFLDFRVTYRSNLLNWIFSFSRADLDKGLGELLDKILKDLIGDYE